MTPDLHPLQPMMFFLALAGIVTLLVALHDWIDRGLKRRAFRLATERLRKRVGS